MHSWHLSLVERCESAMKKSVGSPLQFDDIIGLRSIAEAACKARPSQLLISVSTGFLPDMQRKQALRERPDPQFSAWQVFRGAGSSGVPREQASWLQ